MRILDKLIGSLAPHTCLVCGDDGSVLCGWCRHDTLMMPPERCYRCHALSPNCRTCKSCRSSSALTRVWVATEYNSTARSLIHVLKFDETPAAAEPIAEWMHTQLPHLEPACIIVPIPTASQRVRRRGFDHAVLMARAFARHRRLETRPVLVRVGQTRQVRASREERMTQAQHMFRLPKPGLVKEVNIILIDDVVTTGATLEAAARLLRSAGAKTVSAAVFAQKL